MQFLSSLEIISRREVSVNKLVALTFLVAKVLRNKVNEEIERVIHLTPVGNLQTADTQCACLPQIVLQFHRNNAILEGNTRKYSGQVKTLTFFQWTEVVGP